MVDLQLLQRQHKIFAEEAFAFLLHKFQVESKLPKKFKLFRLYIGEAILAISHIYRNDYWKAFNRLHENLKYAKMFEKYCKIVPVEKNERYFYNFLTRISLIFELTMYCYNEGYNYFKIGCECIAEYDDLEFFESTGGWRKLKYTAEFMSDLCRPLMIIKNIQYNSNKKIATFTDAVKEVNMNFMIEGNIEMLDSVEMRCLKSLNEKFCVNFQATEIKPGNKVNRKVKTGFAKICQSSLKTTLTDTKVLDNELKEVITYYFKQCVSKFVSSKDLIDSMRGNAPHDLNLNTTNAHRNYPNCNVSHRERSTNADLCLNYPIKKDHVDTFDQTSSDNRNENSISNKGNEITEIKVTKRVSIPEMPPCTSNLYSSRTTSNFIERHLKSQNRQNISLKWPESIIDHRVNIIFEKAQSKTRAVKSENPHRNNENSINDDISSAQEVCSSRHIFIVPQKYFDLTNSDDASKKNRLYSAKIDPPSTRKKLDEHLKKILDENIKSQNYNTMPSGDVIVWSMGYGPSQDEETLIIFAESDSDDEEKETNIDTLICLFKKMEIDSQGNESGYSLRSRQSMSGNETIIDELCGSKNTRKRISASDSGIPSKSFRRTVRKLPCTIRSDINYAEKLIRLYKKYFKTFLDEFFKIDFSPVVTKVELKTSSENYQCTCEYVFAVPAGIMARRKVLLDIPDENKPVWGLQLYGGGFFQPVILPLPVQKVLDSHIINRNYFVASNGIYGVGPKLKAKTKSIWAVFFSGDGKSSSVMANPEDILKVPEMFRSLGAALEIFIPITEVIMKMDLKRFEEKLDRIVKEICERRT